MEKVIDILCLRDGSNCSMQNHMVTSDLHWMQEPLVEGMSVGTFWGWVVSHLSNVGKQYMLHCPECSPMSKKWISMIVQPSGFSLWELQGPLLRARTHAMTVTVWKHNYPPMHSTLLM